MKKIIKLIKENESTNRQIALRAGIATPVIYNIVNGQKKDINFTTACKLADALEVSLDELREEVDVKHYEEGANNE
ncbi:helix-turn-helix domain-containing protein [Alkalibacterium sp. f15]|uniref:helix-turn-helix domain-containing protein n=1 Tax=Alkalibacterium sp. f15 TaxID=3414029 RepID=UPI003BF796DD